MPLEFRCADAGCRALIKVGDELAGRTVRCPRCQHVQVVPAPGLAAPADLDVLDAELVTDDRPVLAGATFGPPVAPPQFPDPLPVREIRRPEARSRVGLMVGLAVGGALLLLLLVGGSATALYYVLRSARASAEWKPFSPAGGWCTVTAPGVPGERALAAKGITARKFVSDQAVPGCCYVLVYYDFAPGTVDAGMVKRMADAERDSMGRTFKVELASESKARLEVRAGVKTRSCPGLEFRLTAPDGSRTLVERLFRVDTDTKTRIFLVMASANRANADSVGRFVDSLTVTVPDEPVRVLHRPRPDLP
jgi:hypothetical protein